MRLFIVYWIDDPVRFKNRMNELEMNCHLNLSMPRCDGISFHRGEQGQVEWGYASRAYYLGEMERNRGSWRFEVGALSEFYDTEMWSPRGPAQEETQTPPRTPLLIMYTYDGIECTIGLNGYYGWFIYRKSHQQPKFLHDDGDWYHDMNRPGQYNYPGYFMSREAAEAMFQPKTPPKKHKRMHVPMF